MTEIIETSEEETVLSPVGVAVLALTAVGVATCSYFVGKGVGRVTFAVKDRIEARKLKKNSDIIMEAVVTE